jgi:hypothetical protein
MNRGGFMLGRPNRGRLVRVALALTVAVLARDPLAGQGRTPQIEGPISGGERGSAFGGWAQDAVPGGYMEQEWFLSGTATSYSKSGAWTTDGRWAVTPDASGSYAVRMLVRRPVDEGRFNGMVVVEWLNVTANAEGAADYSQMAEELLREGYAWIGVGAQAVGVHAPGSGLKAWDPVRYAALSHPGDRFSYDIFTQAARAVRTPATAARLLGDLTPSVVLAAGRSQSAFRLVTYINAIHPRDRVFDAYFVHSRGANAAGLTADGMGRDETGPIPAGAWIREDVDVPVFDLQTEGDMVTLGSHQARQPAGDRYRRWEIAGAAHTEIPRWVVEVPPALSMGPGCANPVNAAPHHAFVKSGLRALSNWIRSGVPPRQSPEIEIVASAADPIARDEHGNARGGVRISELVAPTARLDGARNSVASATPGTQNFCFLYGNTVAFDAVKLRSLYPTHSSFVDRFVAAVDVLEGEGYLLAPEAEEARRAARESSIGR